MAERGIFSDELARGCRYDADIELRESVTSLRQSRY